MKKVYLSPNVEVIELQYRSVLISTSEKDANPGLPSLARELDLLLEDIEESERDS